MQSLDLGGFVLGEDLGEDVADAGLSAIAAAVRGSSPVSMCTSTRRAWIVAEFGPRECGGVWCERVMPRSDDGLPIQVDGAEDEVMRIELVVVRDCPHEAAAAVLLRRALDDIGLGSRSVEVVVVESPSVAEEMHFLGSPAFMVEGRDLFDEPRRRAAVACRIYPGGQPLPGLRELRRALKEAAAALTSR